MTEKYKKSEDQPNAKVTKRIWPPNMPNLAKNI